MPLNYTAIFPEWQGFFPYFLCFFGNISFTEDSFPLFSGKDTVYFLEIIRYNQQNDIVCPKRAMSLRTIPQDGVAIFFLFAVCSVYPGDSHAGVRTGSE